MSTTDKLVYMANQIARNLAAQSTDPAMATAGHIEKYWDRRMKAMLAEHLATGGEGLGDTARNAAALIAAKANA